MLRRISPIHLSWQNARVRNQGESVEMDKDEHQRRPKKEILELAIGAAVVIPLLFFLVAYESFGWRPNLPEAAGMLIGIPLAMIYIAFVSTACSAWCYVLLFWVKNRRLRIVIAIAIGTLIGVGAIVNPGTDQELTDGHCNPSGRGIYNDC